MNVTFYLYPIFFVLVINFRRKISYLKLIFILGLFAKIGFAYLMTYLIINLYNFGDLFSYFIRARDLAFGHSSEELNLLAGNEVVVLLNSLIFRILPPSIYGLATITGVSSFIYSYALIRSMENFLPKSYLYKSAYLLLFMPVLGAQSGYIGKETYVLPLLGYFFFAFQRHQRITIWIVISIIAIGIIRPYQAIILIFSIIATLLISVPYKSPIKFKFIAIIFFVAGLFLYSEYFLNQLAIIANLGPREFLSTTYSDGNFILEPYPLPFTVLQNFRPFIWEVNNSMSLIASLENMIPLIFGLIFILFYTVNKSIRIKLNSNQYLLLLCFYVIINLLICSFNSNMGDLARRHIYYYPQMILLGIYTLSMVRDLKKVNRPTFSTTRSKVK